jgi:hypothetical protein
MGMCAGVLIHESFFSNLRVVRWTYLSTAQLSQIARAHVQQGDALRQGDAVSGGQLGELEGAQYGAAGLLVSIFAPLLHFAVLSERARRGRGRTMMEMGGKGVPRDEASSPDGPLPVHTVELSFATAHTYPNECT